ncbi:MAG: helix-turn-helix domain-containing protein [Gammaproteobacteria bacterium]|nr:helix-turn-helix domain-containing protein [Gammaproteobacteria bacterium]
MNRWAFTTENLPDEEQYRAWREAMGRLCLPVGDPPAGRGFRGRISCLRSPLGIEFALVEGGPHSISGRYLDQPAAIWLTLLVEGQAVLNCEGMSFELSPGDIVYGPTFVEATLKFNSDFRQLFINVQRLILSPRCFAPLSVKVGHLRAQSGINRVFSGMLRMLAEELEHVSPEQLRPVELSLTEFLLTSLEDEKSAFSLGGVTGARATHLHRICQNIETMLGDPNLTLSMVAGAEKVSIRYLQKLFAEAGNTFIHYVRTRRLDRCREDLLSPLHADLSISEICFRWGFNGSAHFSRVFRNEFGISPREYRRRGDLITTERSAAGTPAGPERD